MKHAQNPRRGRGRGGPGKRHQYSKNRNYENGGGEARVRGNARQILDKYQAMARDAAAAGEHIMAEGYWQHAEHYHRILNIDRDERPADRENGRSRTGNDAASRNDEAPGTGESQPPANEEKPVVKPVNVQEIPIEAGTIALTGQQAQTPEQAPAAAENQPAEQPEITKPKRRGRPRKGAAKTSEGSDSDASPEPVSA